MQFGIICRGDYALRLNREKEAIFALTKFAAIGFNSWVQSLTGWQSQPQSQPSEPARLKNWTPPELYPQMTQAEFEAIPVDQKPYQIRDVGTLHIILHLLIKFLSTLSQNRSERDF